MSAVVRRKRLAGDGRSILAAVLALAMSGASVFGVAPTRFAGVWVLDKSRSQLVGVMSRVDRLTWTITQSAKVITIVIAATVEGRAQPAQTLTYNLDGSETTAEIVGQMTGKAVLKAKWLDGGKALELDAMSNIRAGDRDLAVGAGDRLELAERGKVLLVRHSFQMPQTVQDSKLVFTRR